jgi:hypothetical protein
MSSTVCYRDIHQAIAEVERECNVRFKCFDRWVADGRLSEVDARDRLERLISAWHYLNNTEESRQFSLKEATEPHKID